MIKRLLIYSAVLLGLFVAGYFSHKAILSSREQVLSFSLLNTYIFHVLASFVVYLIIELVADKLATQAGYAFLASVFVKVGLFTLIFMPTLFSDNELAMYERVSVIVPMFMFLILEAVACGSLLNSK